jgi:hypothetical protein
MIDFKTKKTRTILVLSFIYILVFPILLAFMYEASRSADYGFLHLLILGIKKIDVFIQFYTHGVINKGWDEIFAYIYFAPLFFYWIFFPVLRFIKRWVSRGQ